MDAGDEFSEECHVLNRADGVVKDLWLVADHLQEGLQSASEGGGVTGVLVVLVAFLWSWTGGGGLASPPAVPAELGCAVRLEGH